VKIRELGSIYIHLAYIQRRKVEQLQNPTLYTSNFLAVHC